MKIIPHNQPTIGNEEIKAVAKVLRSKWLITGKEVEKFENAIKKHVHAKYAIGVNSGHSAIHLSLLALGVEKDSEVIVPDYTPADLLNSVYYVCATPILVDIEKNGFNIDPEKIKHKLTKRTKAIIVPHIFGYPAQIDKIKKYNIPVIEDCAQSIGSTYLNKPVGSFGDISIFSFYATKFITTGQGGMIVTNNAKYFNYIKDLIDYNGRDNYKIRYNYPLTDIAASIGNIQFKRLPEFIKRRKYIASQFRKVLNDKKIHHWPAKEDTHVNHFRFIIKLANSKIRKSIIDAMARKGVRTIVPYPAYELLHNLLGQDKLDFLNAENLTHTTLSLPIFPGLKDSEIYTITSALTSVL